MPLWCVLIWKNSLRIESEILGTWFLGRDKRPINTAKDNLVGTFLSTASHRRGATSHRHALSELRPGGDLDPWGKYEGKRSKTAELPEPSHRSDWAELSQPVGVDRLADHFHSKRRSVNAEIVKRKEDDCSPVTRADKADSVSVF